MVRTRTRFTFGVAGVGAVFITAAYLANNVRFSAVAFAILAGLVLSLLPRLGIIQHPLDPIGTSTSNTIRVFYAAILLITLILSGLLATWFRARLASQSA